MKTTTVAAALSMHLIAHANLQRTLGYTGHTPAQAMWFEKHAEAIEFLRKEFLPSGGGFDAGTDVEEGGDRQLLVLSTSYHHMKDGAYTGWTQHVLRIRSRFDGGLDITVTGRNTNDILPFIIDTFQLALGEEIVPHADGITYSRVPEPV